MCSVFWPAWTWIHDPSATFFCASYAQELATRDSIDCRYVIESEWYRSNWGDRVKLIADQNQKTKFSHDGTRLAAGHVRRWTGTWRTPAIHSHRRRPQRHSGHRTPGTRDVHQVVGVDRRQPWSGPRCPAGRHRPAAAHSRPDRAFARTRGARTHLSAVQIRTGTDATDQSGMD